MFLCVIFPHCWNSVRELVATVLRRSRSRETFNSLPPIWIANRIRCEWLHQPFLSHQPHRAGSPVPLLMHPHYHLLWVVAVSGPRDSVHRQWTRVRRLAWAWRGRSWRGSLDRERRCWLYASLPPPLWLVYTILAQGRRRRKSGRLRSARSADEWMGGCVGSTRLRWWWGCRQRWLHQVRQVPREMSWKVLLVTQARTRARDSI